MRARILAIVCIVSFTGHKIGMAIPVNIFEGKRVTLRKNPADFVMREMACRMCLFMPPDSKVMR